MHRKTALGQHEIATRERRLSPRLRSLLILVDGKRSDAELRAMVPESAEALVQLREGGFVEEVVAVREAAKVAETVDVAVDVALDSGFTARPATQPAPMNTAPMPLSAATIKVRTRAASRWINERMGPMGEAAALRLEGAKTPEQFDAAMAFAMRLVSAQLGDSAAESLRLHIATL